MVAWLPREEAAALMQAGGPLPTVLRDERLFVAVERRQKRSDPAFYRDRGGLRLRPPPESAAHLIYPWSGA